MVYSTCQSPVALYFVIFHIHSKFSKKTNEHANISANHTDAGNPKSTKFAKIHIPNGRRAIENSQERRSPDTVRHLGFIKVVQ